MKPLRIAFMGTPDFALEALKALHQTPHELVCVYTQPPRPKGRGQKVQPSPTHEYAQQNGIPVYHPKSLKSKEEQEIFAAHNLDLAIVAAYGLLLPKAILDAPKYGCINIHASLLPRWRGASPIQHAIWKGDTETGITLMQMDEGLDTGPMIAKESIPITADTSTSELHNSLANLGANMVKELVAKLAQGVVLQTAPQDTSSSTYAPLLSKEDGRIDWSQTATEIDRQIRALNPWPGVFIGDGDQRLKILEASIIQGSENNHPYGTVLNKDGDVRCGQNTILRLITIQPSGKTPMDFKSACNGSYITPGKPLV